MAIRFYKTGDAADLAGNLISLLQSPEELRQMAEQNFSAAMRMTMPNIVSNYLRWFELAKHKKRIERLQLGSSARWNWRRKPKSPVFTDFSANWNPQAPPEENGEGSDVLNFHENNNDEEKLYREP